MPSRVLESLVRPRPASAYMRPDAQWIVAPIYVMEVVGSALVRWDDFAFQLPTKLQLTIEKLSSW